MNRIIFLFLSFLPSFFITLGGFFFHKHLFAVEFEGIISSSRSSVIYTEARQWFSLPKTDVSLGASILGISPYGIIKNHSNPTFIDGTLTSFFQVPILDSNFAFTSLDIHTSKNATLKSGLEFLIRNYSDDYVEFDPTILGKFSLGISLWQHAQAYSAEFKFKGEFWESFAFNLFLQKFWYHGTLPQISWNPLISLKYFTWCPSLLTAFPEFLQWSSISYFYSDEFFLDLGIFSIQEASPIFKPLVNVSYLLDNGDEEYKLSFFATPKEVGITAEVSL